MGFRDIIKNNVLEKLTYSNFSTIKIIFTLGISWIVSIYIFLIYRLITKNTFYNKNYNITIAAVSVVTTGIVIALQSNIVISLGMVGALSIVRFRTAIKEPIDLLFLYWSIGTGIVCGAGLYKLAFIITLALSCGLFFIQIIPERSSPLLLIIKLQEISSEDEVLQLINANSKKYKIDSKSITNGVENLVIEIRANEYNSIVNKISMVDGVYSVALLQHTGEVKD